MDIESLIRFTELLTKFQTVERSIRVVGNDRYENDIEHSFELAMLAWYIISKDNLNLNKDLVIQYAMVHDLVEVYAGDTQVYGADQNMRDSKEQRESDAAKALKEEFPDFSDLHHLIEGYEKKEDKESRFVYALDKIQPVLKIYIDKGRTWNELQVSLDMLIDKKVKPVSFSPEIEPYFRELVTFLKDREKDLFKIK